MVGQNLNKRACTQEVQICKLVHVTPQRFLQCHDQLVRTGSSSGPKTHHTQHAKHGSHQVAASNCLLGKLSWNSSKLDPLNIANLEQLYVAKRC